MTASVAVEPGDALPQIADAEVFRADTTDAALGGYAWWQTGSAPAVVLMHGWGQDASYHADRARAFHAAGWHAVSVGLRGWPGSTGDHNDYGLSAEHDLAAIVAAVQEHRPTELWILAYSAGGLVATRGLPAAGTVWGLITVNAPMNVHTEYRDTKAQRMRDYYDDALTPEHWERCSPVTVADRIGTPMLVITGSDDAMIPSSQAAEICQRVPSATYLEIEGMRHLPTDAQWDDILERSARWMDEVRRSR